MSTLLTGRRDLAPAEGVVVRVETIVTAVEPGLVNEDLLDSDFENTYGYVSKSRWDTAAM